MPAKKKITESEYEILKVLWNADGPMNTQSITESLSGTAWQRTTIATLLTRLCEKGGAAFESRGRTHYYYPLISEDEYKLNATKSLIGRVFGGSVKNLVAALYDNNEMTDEEIKEIKEMFELG